MHCSNIKLYKKCRICETKSHKNVKLPGIFFPSSGYLLLCKTKRTETWKAAKNKEYTYAVFALMSIGTCAFVEFFLIFMNLIRNKKLVESVNGQLGPNFVYN